MLKGPLISNQPWLATLCFVLELLVSDTGVVHNLHFTCALPSGSVYLQLATGLYRHFSTLLCAYLTSITISLVYIQFSIVAWCFRCCSQVYSRLILQAFSWTGVARSSSPGICQNRQGEYFVISLLYLHRFYTAIWMCCFWQVLSLNYLTLWFAPVILCIIVWIESIQHLLLVFALIYWTSVYSVWLMQSNHC